MSYLNSLYSRLFATPSSTSTRLERSALKADVMSLLPSKKDARILDVGCGSGAFLLLAMEAGYTQSFGIDANAGQVESARRSGLPNVAVEDPLVHLEKHPKEYDCIVAVDVIERLSKADAIRLMKAIRSALKSNGRVVVRTLNADAPFASINVHGDLTHQLALNARSARQLLETSGFTATELRGAQVVVEGRLRETLSQAVSKTARAVSSVALYALGRSTPSIMAPRLVASAVRTLDVVPAPTPTPVETSPEPEDESAVEAIRFSVSDSSLGSVLVAATAKGVCAVLIGDDPAELEADLKKRFPDDAFTEVDKKFEALAARVVAHVNASNEPLDVPLDLRGTEFQRQVWEALRRIPAGSTESYSEVGARIGLPKSAMAVASACAANAVAVVVPCHRVVRADGSLSGYRWGVERKRALLEREAHG